MAFDEQQYLKDQEARKHEPHHVTGVDELELSHDVIAKAAYYKWLDGGCVDGNDEGDWFAAEAALRETAPITEV